MGVVDGTSRLILIALWGSVPRICPHYVWRLPVLFKPQFHEHHKNSLKIEKNTLKLKPTLLCLAFHGLECHLLPPVNKANTNTLLCLLSFMHSIFLIWQLGHLTGIAGAISVPAKRVVSVLYTCTICLSFSFVSWTVHTALSQSEMELK